MIDCNSNRKTKYRSSNPQENQEIRKVLQFKIVVGKFYTKLRETMCVLTTILSDTFKTKYSRPPPKDGRFSSIFFDPTVRP